MSILVGGVTLYDFSCHGDHMICTIILGLPVIYHPMNVLPFDVHCCLHNSLLFYFIVTPLIEDSSTVLIGCGVSAFIVQLYMIYVYFNIKLNLY